MIYQIEDIKKAVRVCLDQNGIDGMLLTEDDMDTLLTDELIESKVEEAVNRIHKDAPYTLLEQGHNFGDAVYWGDKCSGWVLLPRDYMRLVVFEMDDWERAVYEPLTTDDPRYRLQRSRVKGLRGTAQRPVCVEATRPEGRVLEFYSCRSEEAAVSRAVYMPWAKINRRDDSIDISERCYTAVIYTTAALTLVSMGEAERGGQLMELVKTELGR